MAKEAEGEHEVPAGVVRDTNGVTFDRRMAGNQYVDLGLDAPRSEPSSPSPSLSTPDSVPTAVSL